jgi:hypothetical protein
MGDRVGSASRAQLVGRLDVPACLADTRSPTCARSSGAWRDHTRVRRSRGVARLRLFEAMLEHGPDAVMVVAPNTSTTRTRPRSTVASTSCARSRWA